MAPLSQQKSSKNILFSVLSCALYLFPLCSWWWRWRYCALRSSETPKTMSKTSTKNILPKQKIQRYPEQIDVGKKQKIVKVLEHKKICTFFGWTKEIEVTDRNRREFQNFQQKVLKSLTRMKLSKSFLLSILTTVTTGTNSDHPINRLTSDYFERLLDHEQQISLKLLSTNYEISR